MKTLLSTSLGNRAAASAVGGLVAAWASLALISDFTIGGELVLALA